MGEMGNTENMESGLIEIVQLPVIEQRLLQVKEQVDIAVSEALTLDCTEETIKAVKAARADLNTQFNILEERRKAVKASIVGPYKKFEEIYNSLVGDAYKTADKQLRDKILSVEGEIKSRCEAELHDYFHELCAVEHIDFLRFDQIGLKIGLTEARQKTHRKLREQIKGFIDAVVSDVSAITGMDDAAEIMTEYRKVLILSTAVHTVRERHRLMKEQSAAIEERKNVLEQENEMVRRVEAFAPPVVSEAPEKDPDEMIPRLTFTCINATRAQLRRVRDFLNREGIQYE